LTYSEIKLIAYGTNDDLKIF